MFEQGALVSLRGQMGKVSLAIISVTLITVFALLDMFAKPQNPFSLSLFKTMVPLSSLF